MVVWKWKTTCDNLSPAFQANFMAYYADMTARFEEAYKIGKYGRADVRGWSMSIEDRDKCEAFLFRMLYNLAMCKGYSVEIIKADVKKYGEAVGRLAAAAQEVE